MYKYSDYIVILVKVMKRVAMVWVLATFIVGMLLVSGFAHGENLTFSQTAAAGDASDGNIDIVKVSGSYDSSYQYFSIETRNAGFSTPPTDTSYTFTIDVEADVNGEDVTEYVYISLVWQNNGGNITHSYTYTTHNGGGGTLSESDVQISGSKMTVRVPAMLFQDVQVYNVEFTSGALGNGYSYDQVTYYTSGNNSGGSTNGGNGGGTTSGPDVGSIMWIGSVAGIACAVIFFVIWLFVSLWAYKDAKKKCNSSPIVWFLVVFFLSLLGLIIYVIVVKDECQKQQAYVPPPPPQ